MSSASVLNGLLFFFDDFFGWKWILLVGFGMFQFGCIEVFDAIDEIQFFLFLFDCCKSDRDKLGNIKILDIKPRGILFARYVATHLPSKSGNGFFSWVCACFNLVASKCSMPEIRFCCVFSVATSIEKERNREKRNKWKNCWQWNLTNSDCRLQTNECVEELNRSNYVLHNLAAFA